MINGYNGMFVCGNFPTAEEMAQEQKDIELGIVRHHDTTYLEYSIPKELEKELEEMIDKRLDEFFKVCQCEDCKKDRNKTL